MLKIYDTNHNAIGVLINVLYPRSPINIKYDISLSDFAPPFNVKSYELSGLLSSPRFL